MLRTIPILLLLAICFMSLAQPPSENPSITTGNIYALIIGISDYQDEEIQDLQFAHRDAEIFAEYLQSKAGGSVPKDHMKVLTNNEATVANIYVAKKWLEDQVQEGDLAYFYFSGHGDVESSLYKLGFLLASDTPNKNYLNNAVRIEDLNIMANTLSVMNDVNVIMITDACHSGKLSGSDNRGQQLVGEQLSKAQKNEVRIASCEASQLSQEDAAWGGGRGAFSYYLVNGLMGLADDDDQDGLITLFELKNYLEKQVPKDVFKIKSEEQIPVVDGKSFTKLAYVDQDALSRISNTTAPTVASTAGGSRSVNQTVSSESAYFDYLKNVNIRDNIPFSEWRLLSQQKFIDSLLVHFSHSIDTNISQSNWYKNIHSDPEIRHNFSQQLGALIHNEVQKTINAYLIVDQKELEKRQYYNIENQNFIQYVYMLEVAEKLIDNQNYLHQIIQQKKYYFKGLNDRFNAFLIKNNTDSLMQEAMKAQKAALSIDAKAAYVQNELGLILKFLGDFDNASTYLEKAMQLIPTWSIPVSNLSSLYYIQGDYEKGLQFAQKAIALQDGYYLSYINCARNASKLHNLLLAEECLQKATRIDFQHYLAFEELGYLYLTLTHYDKAENYFLEAEKRKSQFIIEAPNLDGDGIFNFFDSGDVFDSTCFYDSTKVQDQDIMAMFAMGLKALKAEKFQLANKHFERIIHLNRNNPLVYRYLGESFFRQKDWTTSIHYFQMAEINYLDSIAFAHHFENLLPKQSYLVCGFENDYKNSAFDKVEIHYFLGEAAEKLEYNNLAKEQYEEAIKLKPESIIPYFKLFKLFEKQKLYLWVEKTIERIKDIDKAYYRNEIYAFYNRMIYANQDPNLYHYKAGIMLYQQIMEEGPENQIDFNYFTQNKSSAILFQDSYIVTPGTQTKIEKADSYNFLIESSIQHFKSIETEYQGENRAIICNKLAELYEYYGDIDSSLHYYAIAVELNPMNASYKLDYYLMLKREFELSQALEVLDSLHLKEKLLYDQKLNYGQYLAQSGRFDEAFVVFLQAKKTNILVDSIAFSEEIIAHVLANRIDDAILLYLEFDKMYPSAPHVNYSLARMYALQNKERAAFKHLTTALDEGFNDGYVLRRDKNFENYHESKKWKKLLTQYNLTQPTQTIDF